MSRDGEFNDDQHFAKGRVSEPQVFPHRQEDERDVQPEDDIHVIRDIHVIHMNHVIHVIYDIHDIHVNQFRNGKDVSRQVQTEVRKIPLTSQKKTFRLRPF